MLQSLRLGPAQVDPSRVLPPVLLPLVHAAQRGSDLVAEIESISRHFQFDSFMYGVAVSPRPDNESCVYAFTTMPMEWVGRYDQMAYVGIDPRVSGTWDTTAPLLWDQTTTRGKSARIYAFLDDALAHGIGSVFASHCTMKLASASWLCSAQPRQSSLDSRQQQIARDLGEMVVFAHYFHDLFMKGLWRRECRQRRLD